jgi:hypothetical protein
MRLAAGKLGPDTWMVKPQATDTTPEEAGKSDLQAARPLGRRLGLVMIIVIALSTAVPGVVRYRRQNVGPQLQMTMPVLSI